jgi:hypothetical protein
VIRGRRLGALVPKRKVREAMLGKCSVGCQIDSERDRFEALQWSKFSG